MSEQEKALYTIGYAGFSLENFLSVLKTNSINAIVDVRAMPHISHFDCYKRNNIKAALRENGLTYKFFGSVFGARPENPAFYTNGKADFAKIRADAGFQATCHNLAEGLDKGFTICLMCAQIDPIICHRAILITDYFRYIYPDIPVLHIRPGKMETQTELDKRLVALYRKNKYGNSLFAVPEKDNLTELQKAYAWQGNEIAYEAKQANC